MSKNHSFQRNLILFSPIDWDEVWEGPQEIATRFAAAGWRVLFVENLGARPPRLNWQDMRRIGTRIKSLVRNSGPRTLKPEAISVYTPFNLPAWHWLQKQNQAMLTAQFRAELAKLGMERPIVWAYNPSALVRQVSKALDPRLLVYCCIHDFATISPQHMHLADEEEEMLRTADLIFVLSHRLCSEKSRGRANVHLLPQGANLQDYLNFTGPANLQSFPRPVIGYIGTIHEWFDQNLLKYAAQARPEWTFVFIGPHRVNIDVLRSVKNIVLLGPKNHSDLPAYVAQFDVGIIPYVNTAFASTIRPNKVLEYMVMGKPVVTTRLPELEIFRNHLLSADSPREFLQAIELALANDCPSKRQERREVAIANSMDRKFGEIENLLLSHLSQESESVVSQSLQ